MYGDDDSSGPEDNRPLSFLASPKLDNEHADSGLKPHSGDHGDDHKLRLVRTTSDQSGGGHVNANGFALRKSQTFPARLATERTISHDGPRSPLSPLSPTPSLRAVQADESQFPTNIDNPNDIAQELSNLQALRRMSMDVGNHTRDPDLLPFSGVSLMAMPSIAPTGDDDEADPSRLLWVPARVHPELEPTAFKNFLENRVQTMKRRSGETLLTPDGASGGNPGSLRRKKSMLSRQVNPNADIGDSNDNGSERLRRHGSLGEYATPELSLNELVKDPTKVVQKLAQDTMAECGDSDSPILPVAPGMGLRRSTKTTYRKGGSQRYGDRATFSKRISGKQSEHEIGDEPPPVPALDPMMKPLARVNSEPIAQNYSRPQRTVRRQHNFSRDLATDGAAASDAPAQGETDSPASPDSPPSQRIPARSASATERRTPAHSAPSVPQIVETPPVEETAEPPLALPERSSSQKATQQQTPPDQPPVDGPPARSNKRPGPIPVQSPPSSKPGQPETSIATKEKAPAKENPLSEISQPTTLPGSGGSTTSSSTFVPTFDNADKKVDRRSKDKDETNSIISTKSTSSWKWFKSGDKEKKKKDKEEEREREKEREREAEREREREEQAKMAKSKSSEKGHDNARLDVLQKSIDNPKGRESLRLDRDSIELPPDDKKKETSRKSSDSKKEREGFFGGLFGGSKKKGSDKEQSHKKKDQRPLTPEPPQRAPRPDVDYHWTRFPIIEERAIYRMAHIKLANPRRPLHSQVLLSNFMYSYLAKVQAMHPQLNVPISPQQKRQEEERKRREAEEQRQRQLELEQQLAAQQAAQDGNFGNFDYHRSGSQYGDSPVQHDGSVQYVDDSQIYEYEHGGDHQQQHQNINGNNHDYQQQQQQQQLQQNQTRDQNYYYARGDTSQFDDDDERSDMW
ncbi:hypothetical protein QBC42DRAFT_186744 [Cladorrhinum samala]|uniref:Protein Zds1 C-terminal domain-containing protein n=1 Tax=Cladorrhinum samala TaxID=585594 RepID=A0AAV9HBI2_9PEZI|nr:hypothetical protein QBC42DRAFT_186744 [Cladorrhinum samala]